ncbi:lytic polysaccharide monooxygenase [Streptomyces phyllanthi]|uniref:Lytic polysaccharide monooxygenase n=1 Tax=Streptomyces phyllanthi TaxID=1803180 RepID=A0A5N8WA64_9ACTN|nr:lytic polysaccharide monooxygenase [Streptomyces phyllanthi]MPY44393.1 lytic polysaccharide monooxygenase [Streptomyces phyllanthi]
MPARRKAAALAASGMTALALTSLTAAPAAAHGSMGDPVSRAAQCRAEGPENPRSAACRAAVAAGGTQALYDWNGVRIGDAGGRHRELIPDGRLCGAGDEAFKGLDLARADWPATRVSSGSYTFRYQVTAPHKGTFTVYVTKPGYDPSGPLAWDDLDLAHPVATATDPVASGGFHTFSGTLPKRSGKQLLYAIWQRSDSPEAFYSCSDVDFGGDSGGAGGGKGDARTETDPPPEQTPTPTPTPSPTPTPATDSAGGDEPTVSSTSGHGNEIQPAGAEENLADTGGDSVAPYIAIGGAGALALGSSVLFAVARRRAGAHTRR